MLNVIKRLFQKEEGQGMIEYALIAALISVVAIVTIRLIGPQLTTIWTNILNALS